jgi:pyrroline-5-carboxylate reductase
MTMTDQTLAAFDGDLILYGCGAMAGAMLSRWIACGLNPARATALRPSGTPAPGGVRTVTNSHGLAAPSVLLIGIKPQLFAANAADIARLAGPDTLVLSIMAGITLDDLALALPNAAGVVRVMPNMPVADGRGIAITVGSTPGLHAQRRDRLLAPLGHVHAMPDENGFNLVTALTGCGPAFVYRFVAGLAGAAVRLGLDPADADVLARITVAGAAQTMLASPQSPTALADAVASPGGMTQAGLDVLDSDGRLVALLAETLRAARDRGRELAAAARGEG